MMIDKLIIDYINLASLHGELIQNGDKKANKIHSKVEGIIIQIKNSTNYVRQEFYDLLTHNNSSVRCWTAIELINTFQEKSVGVLKELSNGIGLISLTAKTLIDMREIGLIKKDNWEE